MNRERLYTVRYHELPEFPLKSKVVRVRASCKKVAVDRVREKVSKPFRLASVELTKAEDRIRHHVR